MNILRKSFLGLLMLMALTASATQISFVFTNSIGNPDTNLFKVWSVSQPDAFGNYTQTGIPLRMQPNASGYIQTNLLMDNYVATNGIFGSFLFRVLINDSGPTVYFVNDGVGSVQISGNQGFNGRLMSTFVTVFASQNTNATVTYNSVTNALGYAPLKTNQNIFIYGDAIGIGSTNIVVTVTNYSGEARKLTTNIVLSLVTTSTNSYATTNYVNSSLLITNSFIRNVSGYGNGTTLSNATVTGAFIGNGALLTNLPASVASNSFVLYPITSTGSGLTSLSGLVPGALVGTSDGAYAVATNASKAVIILSTSPQGHVYFPNDGVDVQGANGLKVTAGPFVANAPSGSQNFISGATVGQNALIVYGTGGGLGVVAHQVPLGFINNAWIEQANGIINFGGNGPYATNIAFFETAVLGGHEAEDGTAQTAIQSSNMISPGIAFSQTGYPGGSGSQILTFADLLMTTNLVDFYALDLAHNSHTQLPPVILHMDKLANSVTISNAVNAFTVGASTTNTGAIWLQGTVNSSSITNQIQAIANTKQAGSSVLTNLAGTGAVTNLVAGSGVTITTNSGSVTITATGVPAFSTNSVAGIFFNPSTLGVIVGNTNQGIAGASFSVNGGVFGGIGNKTDVETYQDIVVGGSLNSFLGSGSLNVSNSIIAGGYRNVAFIAINSGIYGGESNNLSDPNATTDDAIVDSAIVAGKQNTISGQDLLGTHENYDLIGGGISNYISTASTATILGGTQSSISSDNSMAIGANVNITNTSVYAYSDGSGGALNSRTNKTYLINALNGVGIGTNLPAGYGLNVKGNVNSYGFFINGVAVTAAGNPNALTNTQPTAQLGGAGLTNGFFSSPYISVAQSFLAYQQNSILVVTNAATAIANGAYFTNFLGAKTNFAGALETNNGAGLYLIMSGATTLYSSPNEQTNAWTAVSGSGTPISYYGIDFNASAVRFLGVPQFTNIDNRISTSVTNANRTFFLVSGSPNTVVSATRPALCYTEMGGLWVKTNNTADANGWRQIVVDGSP